MDVLSRVPLFLKCTPFFSTTSLFDVYLPAARSCLTSLPLYSLFFPSNCSPVQPRVSLSFHLAAFELSFSLRSIPSIMFYLSSSTCPSLRPAPFLFHFRLLSLSCFILRHSSISLLFPLSYPTRSAFLFLWLSVSLGEALYPRSSVCLCPDTNLNLFFSFSLFLSFNLLFIFFFFYRCSRRWFASFSLLHCICSLEERLRDSSPLPQRSRGSSIEVSRSLPRFHLTRVQHARVKVFVTRTIYTQAHTHSFSRIHWRSHRDISFAYSISILSWSDDRFRLSHDYQSDLASWIFQTPGASFIAKKTTRWSREQRGLNNDKLDGFQ